MDAPVGTDTGILESQGTPVEPGSLFEAQLELRLGNIPVWLNSLHTEWAILRNTPLPNISPTVTEDISEQSLVLGTDKDNKYVGLLP